MLKMILSGLAWIKKLRKSEEQEISNRKTILVIDDDISIRLLLEHLLKFQYNVITEENGLEGLRYMSSGKIPDLIITDVAMPKLNGLDFLKNLKGSGFYRDIPLIVLSGTESSVDIIKCLQLGADDYLLKPFNPELLIQKIDNLLQNINLKENV